MAFKILKVDNKLKLHKVKVNFTRHYQFTGQLISNVVESVRVNGKLIRTDMKLFIDVDDNYVCVKSDNSDSENLNHIEIYSCRAYGKVREFFGRSLAARALCVDASLVEEKEGTTDAK